MAHFSMNSQMNSRVDEEASSDSDHRHKRRKMNQNVKQTAAASSASPAAKPNSFAANMMAKMGYVEGQGLGATGRGRLAPVETQVRPTGAGLGAVREKTKQAKEEEKREAAFRGEILEDSEEEEKKRRKELRKKRMSAVGGAASTPAKPKTKYRTAAEIEADAEGLQVPNVLKSIIDATGTETKLLTSTAGLMTTHNQMVSGETEAVKIARKARREVEAFVDEWNTVSEQRKFCELEESQYVQEMDELDEDSRGLKKVIEAIQDLQSIVAEDWGIPNDATLWGKVTKKLECLENDYVGKLDTMTLQEVAVAAIHPLFKTAMHDWRPLEGPVSVTPYLLRFSQLLGIQPASYGTDLVTQSDPQIYSSRLSKSTTPYETMLYTLFLPPLRSAITNDWDPNNPSLLLSLIQIWSPILPAFILTGLTHNLIPTRLITLLATWKSSKQPSSKHPQPQPHSYIFPWLPYLPPDQLSTSSPTGLFATLKEKLKSLFQSYPLTSGPPSTLTSLFPILPHSFLKEMLNRHLLPRLATHLSHNFLIDPSDQVLTPFTAVLAWTTPSWSFPTATTAHLMQAEFFPKWHHVLYLWLTNSPNNQEISEWFQWWKEQFPEPLRDHEIMAKEWTKGLETINLALDLGPENVAAKLPPPEAGPVRPLPSQSAPSSSKRTGATAKATTVNDEPITFRSVVESWCADNSLLFIPLREADPATGYPLFRITASASGKGGVVAYLKGDVVWGRDAAGKKGGAPVAFKPVGLGEGLLERAEGR
ncbi:MAG: hypothetical protein L6R37_001580 [Teloschistes peruensis]|nr:MAG: hypothetical protein L6R37_001580 [Teloschistes peruensis]